MLYIAVFTFLLAVSCAAVDTVVLEVISVSDTHGWIYGHKHEPIFGDYGTLASYIDHARADVATKPTHSLLAIDGGDLIEGTGLSDATPIKGMYIYQAASEMGFDVITVGNHDLGTAGTTDYIHEQVSTMFRGSYISTNVFMSADDSPLVRDRFKHQLLPNGLNVLMFGFLYESSYESSYARSAKTVIGSDQMTRLLDEYFNLADVLVVVNHISSSDKELEEIAKAFRSYYDARGYTIPLVLISAHSHREYNKTCPFDSTGQCFIVEAECYLKRIQHVKYTFEKYNFTDRRTGMTRTGYRMPVEPEVMHPSDAVVAELAGRFRLTPETFDTDRGIALREKIQGWVDSLSLKKVLGCSKYAYTKSKGVEKSDSIFNLWLNAVMPAEAYNNVRSLVCTQYPMIGSSSVRDSIYEGEFVVDDAYNIMPFANSLAYIPQLTAEEVACIFTGLSRLHTEEEQRKNVYAREAAHNDIPRYVTPSNPTTLSAASCYDLILTSYDAAKFASFFKPDGKCYHLVNASKSYEALDYPSQPLPNVLTNQLLPMFFSDYMPCQASVPVVGDSAEGKQAALEKTVVKIVLCCFAGFMGFILVTGIVLLSLMYCKRHIRMRS